MARQLVRRHRDLIEITATALLITEWLTGEQVDQLSGGIAVIAQVAV